jgi:hypothetical protein
MPKYFTFVLLFIYTTACSQTEADIRKYYTDVNKRVVESIENGYEGPLYQNQIILNKNKKSWPAIDRFEATTDFWYDDTPDHISAIERNPKNVLLKVDVMRITLHMKTNEEYLYKNGKLVFYYCQQGEEGNEWETRMYFNTKGILFKSSVKANGKELTTKDFLTEDYKDFKPNATITIADGKKYQDLFIKSM